VGPSRVKGGVVLAAKVAGLALFTAACTAPNQLASNSPEASPSTPVVSTTPSTSPTPAASPPVAAPSASTLSVTSLPLHNGEVGIGYLAVTLHAAGGTPPYAWTVGGGTLPPGLSLSSGGVITGKNTISGHFGFSAKVTDSIGQVATGAAAMQVFPALGASQPCATLCNVGFGCTKCGRFGGLSGGAGPYHYKLVSGVVPPGMTLSGFVLNGAFPAPTFLGPPVDVIVAGPPPRMTWSLAVQVTDDFGATRTVSANWLVFPPIHMLCTDGVPCATCVTDQCTDSTIQYVLGSPSDSVTVQVVRVCDGNGACVSGSQIDSALPPNWAATASGGKVTVSFDCAGQCQNGLVGDVIFVLIDHGAGVAPAYVQSNEADYNIAFTP
jgi:hypothetical protein